MNKENKIDPSLYTFVLCKVTPDDPETIKEVYNIKFIDGKVDTNRFIRFVKRIFKKVLKFIKRK